MDVAKTRTLLELFSESGELLLDFGKFPPKCSDFLFQVGEAIGGRRSGVA